MEIMAVVRRRGDHPNGVPSLEIWFGKDKAQAIGPMPMSITLALAGDRTKPSCGQQRRTSMLGLAPSSRNTAGTSIKLAEVLPKAGFKNKDKVRLEVSVTHPETGGPATVVTLTAVRENDELERIRATKEAEGAFNASSPEDARERVLGDIVLRQGRVAFRGELLVAYQSRCAVTGCDAVQALEAAHIVPYFGPETDKVINGLLLRADIHTLFDLALIAIGASDYRMLVSKSLRGTCYASLAGQEIRLPEDPREYPNRQALERRLREFQSKEGENDAHRDAK